MALLSSITSEWALDQLCSFSQNSCDWDLARILKYLYRAKRRASSFRGREGISQLSFSDACGGQSGLASVGYSALLLFTLLLLYFQIYYYIVSGLHAYLCTTGAPGAQGGDKPACGHWESNLSPLKE